jgi:hypothetical protein
VPVKFDMLHNEIDIEKKETLLSLIGIDSIAYPDSNYQNMILKTGYPSINEHDTNSLIKSLFHQPLRIWDIQKLKLIRIKILILKMKDVADLISSVSL